MTANKPNNRLITPELAKALDSYPLYSQDAKKIYSIVVGLRETEYGYLSANEMAGITYDASQYGLDTLRIEQNKDAELQAFLSRLYDNN